ncbi:MarR family transcriptional regulator (plasmid) [Kovacikia minuta CCNUW1]|uniref:MarR family winged helix-turn-helix transcriptional regulator n=1 Tax=Kovacikia minuta TaxID=2931930 RepID=UPI001CCBE789|nr:MarR family transcriptional regulator [Kovacikia minuta]UBF30034.1 MarR family transcriptional regulator [Kovacikia minuta CCNUW1]
MTKPSLSPTPIPVEALEQPNPPPNPEQCAEALMETIHPILQFIRAEMRSQRSPSLSVPQFRVLAFLGRHPGTSLSEVAEHSGVTRATASNLIDRLVQQQFVDRIEHPQERRSVMLTLTQLGSAHLERSRQSTRQTIAQLLTQLTPEELTTVSSGLQILDAVFNGTHHDSRE